LTSLNLCCLISTGGSYESIFRCHPLNVIDGLRESSLIPFDVLVLCYMSHVNPSQNGRQLKTTRWLQFLGYSVAFLKKVVQSGSLLTPLFVKVFRYGNYEAKGRELYPTRVERNTEEQLRAPGLRPEALCRSACVSDLNLNPALVSIKWA
jgi:hypothetical protein